MGPSPEPSRKKKGGAFESCHSTQECGFFGPTKFLSARFGVVFRSLGNKCPGTGFWSLAPLKTLAWGESAPEAREKFAIWSAKKGGSLKEIALFEPLESQDI